MQNFGSVVNLRGLETKLRLCLYRLWRWPSVYRHFPLQHVVERAHVARMPHLRNENGDLVANGGRVLGVAAMGDDIATSHQNAYQALNSIEWPEGFFRRDIGWRVIKN